MYWTTRRKPDPVQPEDELLLGACVRLVEPQRLHQVLLADDKPGGDVQNLQRHVGQEPSDGR